MYIYIYVSCLHFPFKAVKGMLADRGTSLALPGCPMILSKIRSKLPNPVYSTKAWDLLKWRGIHK